MSVGIKQFWTSLVESKLLDEPACDFFESKFESENPSNGDIDVQTLANWLCQQKAISPFQADILASNQASRLRVGNYVISSETKHDTNLASCFGHHILTRHPVKLTFVGGSDTDALAKWHQIRELAKKRQSLKAGWVTRIYETVSIPEYRFVASEIPSGKSIADLIPIKSRLPATKLIPIIYQAALGIQALNEAGLTAGDNMQQSLFLAKSGSVSLDPPLQSEGRGEEDIKNLGILWFRLASGRNPQADLSTGKVPNDELVKLKKYECSNETIRLLQAMLFVNAAKRPDLVTVLSHITAIAKAAPLVPPKVSELESAYIKWLNSSPVVDTGLKTSYDKPAASELAGVGNAAKKLDADFEPSHVQTGSIDTASNPRSKSMFVPILGSTIAVAVVLAIVVFATLNIPQGTVAKREPDLPNSNLETNLVTVPKRTVTESDFITQRLVSDDQKTLWETPTTGPNIDFSFVPPAPKIAFVLRPAQLLATEQGGRILRALGPRINADLDQLQKNIGFELSAIDQLLITFHSNDQFEYEPFFVVTLTDDKSTESLRAAWGDPESKLFEETEYLSRDNDSCFYVLESAASANKFLFSNQTLIEESLSLGGINSLSGAFQKLALDSDSDRHFTAMFMRTGLFNDAGQKLMGAELGWLNRKISVAINQFVRGIAISIHVEDGTYLEIDFDHTVDLKPDELKTLIRNELNTMANDIQSYAKQLSSNTFWDSARQRAGAMARDFVTNLRIGSEEKQVLCNGWYHPAAVQNWFATTELLLAFGPSQLSSNPTTAIAQTPATLEQLLATPRNLTVNTSPDLVILINNLQQEIIDDYGSLPFEFEIRLMGSDLSKQGITQNQRPSDFDLKQTPLSDILTEIMVRANPDKNISGPSDPNCKMVWVVADDPKQSGRKIIMITTRVAAQEKSYELPAAFLPK